MQPLVSLGIVIVKVQPGRTEVHLQSLVFASKTGRQDPVHARRQAALMHRHRLVEIEVVAQFVLAEVVGEKVEGVW